MCRGSKDAVGRKTADARDELTKGIVPPVFENNRGRAVPGNMETANMTPSPRFVTFSIYSGCIAEHGEWTQETQDKIDRIFGGALPLDSIYYFARSLTQWDAADRADRAKVEKSAAGYFCSTNSPPEVMRPAIIEAAIIVACDPVFAALTKVREDYDDEWRYGTEWRNQKPTMNTEELDKFRKWAEGREAAAATLDIETCEYWWQHVDMDTYSFHRAEGTYHPAMGCVGREYFVRGPDSDGAVSEHDLSEAQHRALRARIERNRKLGLGNGDLLNEPNTPERERAAEEAAKAGRPFQTPIWMERAEGKEAGSIPLPRGLD
jgi:hypothetical protein